MTLTKIRQMTRAGLRAAVFTAAALACVDGAQAQTASQLVAPSYAPSPVRAVEEGVSLDGATGLEAPKGAERLHVTLSGLVVEGGRPELAAETTAADAALTNKRVTGADLFAAARRLEEAYAKAGYLLVRVSLPPQTIKNGRPLRLVVTDGHVEAIDASALPNAVRGRIETILAPLIGKKGLTKAELERCLLLAGDTPGVMLKSTLKAGSVPGSTVIVIDGRYDAVTSILSMDNSLADDLGRYTVGLGADFNSLLGLGEVAYIRLNGYPGFEDDMFDADPRNRQIIAGFTLPLGTDGFWLNVEGVDSRTHPTSGLSYTMTDHFQRLSSKLGYTWIRARDLNTESSFAFEVTKEKQTLTQSSSAVPFTEDQLRVLRFTQTAEAILSDGERISGGLTLSAGLDALGARSATADLPLSRDGAAPDFRKLEAFTSYSRLLIQEQVHLSVTAKAQTSFGDPLVSSEQFGLGGFDWLSGFNSGDMQGDSGAAMRVELSLPFTNGLGHGFGSAVAPYVFGAAGIAKLEQPTAVEQGLVRAASFGAGLRIGLSERASPTSASLTLEYARGEATGTDGVDRFNMRFIARF